MLDACIDTHAFSSCMIGGQGEQYLGIGVAQLVCNLVFVGEGAAKHNNGPGFERAIKGYDTLGYIWQYNGDPVTNLDA